MAEPAWKTWTNERERYEERAAILEFCAGMTRERAELEAWGSNRRPDVRQMRIGRAP